jgi:hypothetical protein
MKVSKMSGLGPDVEWRKERGLRKLLLVSCLILAFTAAEASAGALDFGFKGGINIANIHGEDPGDEGDWKNGFSGGILLDWGITPVFGIQPELLYVQNGTKTDFLDAVLSLKFNYLQVPVLAMVDLPVGGQLIPVLYAGPYVSILLDSDLTLEADENSATVGLKDYTKSYDSGFVFGAAIDFGLGAGKMTIEGRYNLGMVEIDDGIGTGLLGIEDIEKTDMKNESWMIMAGFTF